MHNEDGSNFHCLACDQTCDETEPEWSPDGGSVVFQSNCGGSYDVWTVSASGGTPWQLTSESLMDEREPSWSIKDQIVYRVSPKGENIAGIDDIYIAQIKDTGYPIGFQGRSPVWSPDGTKIAYMSNDPGTWQIFVYDLNAAPGNRSATAAPAAVSRCGHRMVSTLPSILQIPPHPLIRLGSGMSPLMVGSVKHC